MHFFLNKAGWYPAHGYYPAPDYNNVLAAMQYIQRYTMPPGRLAKIIMGNKKWPPNMGSTTRTVQQFQPIKP